MTQHERDLARYRKHIARGYREGRSYVSLPLTIAAELLAGYDAAVELRAEQGQPTKPIRSNADVVRLQNASAARSDRP